MTLTRRLLLLGPCLLLFGCESVSDVIAKQRPQVEKSFAAIAALQPQLSMAKIPALTQKVSPTLILEGSGTSLSNATFIYSDDITEPAQARPVVLRTVDSTPLLQCGSLLKKGTYFSGTLTRPMPSAVAGYLSACARLRYVLVIRQREFVPPQLSLESRQFTKGRYQAEVLAFDLAGGDLIGGFLVEAQNDESVRLLDGDADHLKRLMDNLEGAVYSALRDGARRAFPGSLATVEP